MTDSDNLIVVYSSDDERIDASENGRWDQKTINKSNIMIQETDDESEISNSYGGNSQMSSYTEDNFSNSVSKRNETMDGSIKNHLTNNTVDQSTLDTDSTYDSVLEEKVHNFVDEQKSSDSSIEHHDEVNKVKKISMKDWTSTVTNKNTLLLKKSNKIRSHNEYVKNVHGVIKEYEITSDSGEDEKVEVKKYGSFLNSSDDEVAMDKLNDSLINQSTDHNNHLNDEVETNSDHEESFIRIKKKSNIKKKMNRILSDSEDDQISDREEDSGRLTPSIQKAIRRSISLMCKPEFSTSESEESESEESIVDEQEADGDGDENGLNRSDEMVHSFKDEEDIEDNNGINHSAKMVQSHSEDEENDNNKYENKKKKNSFVISGYDEDDSDEQDNNKKQENSNNVSKKSFKSFCSNTDEDELATDLHKDEKSSSNVEIPNGKISINSDFHRSVNLSSERVSNNYSIHEEHSLHQENSSNNIICIDSATSTEDECDTLSKKSLTKLDKNQLEEEIQRLTQELERSKAFLLKGNLKLLPDSGKNLKALIITNANKIEQLKTQLNELEPSGKSDSSVISLDQNHDASLDNIKSTDDSEYDPNDSYISPKKITQTFNRTQMMKPTADTNLEGLGKKALETFQNEQALTVERLEHFHGSLVSRPTENERAEDPRGLLVPLMPHQQHALAWLLWREQQKPRGGVLADDMGLGKTLTMISLVIKTLAGDSSDDEDSDNEWMGKGRQNEHRGGTLVVCPASLINQWKNEVDKRCKRGVLAVEVYHGNNREKVARRLARNDMVITTYNLLSREVKTNGQIFQIRWKRVVLDEAHCIRNHKSQCCDAVCKLKATKRWALTGTPIHNKEMDIFAILKFLQCSPFDDLRVWKRWVENKSSAGVERLATVMKTLMLRRTKQELISKGEVESLPEKFMSVIKVTLDKDERLVYDKVMMHSKTIFAQFLHQQAEKQSLFAMGANPIMDYRNRKFNKAQQQLLAHHANDVKSHQILVLLLRLRQICCQPALIHEMLDKEEMEMNGLDDDGLSSKLMRMNISISTSEHGDNDDEEEDEEVGVDQRVTENLLTSDNPVFDMSRKSSKLRVIIDIIRDILEKQEKMIIVSQWTSYLNIIGNCLRKIPGATFEMFTGQVAVKNRQAIVDSFNLKKNPRILLLSLCAGGVGLNLVGGNHLILVDIHWNPQLESQAQDRIYRFGQKKNVHIYKILCMDTIEERIQNLQEHKKAIAASILDGTGRVSSKLTMQDLKSLFDM